LGLAEILTEKPCPKIKIETLNIMKIDLPVRLEEERKKKI